MPGDVVAALKVRAEDDRAEDDPAADVRSAAIQALATLAPGDPDVRPFLLARLEDSEEDGAVRASAYEALGGEWRASRWGLRYCSDPARQVRRVAYRDLSRSMPMADLVELAAGGLDDPDLQVRYAAIRLVPAEPRGAPGPWRRALPGVFAALDDPYDYVRWDACRALRGLTAGTEQAPGRWPPCGIDSRAMATGIAWPRPMRSRDSAPTPSRPSPRS